jgi:hypothetical protein
VIPVARNVWQHVDEGRPAALARRLTMRKTSFSVIGRSVSLRVLGIDEEQARKVGAAFGQNAIVVGRRGSVAELMWVLGCESIPIP